MSDDRVALSGLDRFNPSDGAYLLLTDYGPEGLSVSKQSRTLEGLLPTILEGQTGGRMAVVKVVAVTMVEDD